MFSENVRAFSRKLSFNNLASSKRYHKLQRSKKKQGATSDCVEGLTSVKEEGEEKTE